MNPLRFFNRIALLAGLAAAALAGPARAQVSSGALYYNRYDSSTGVQLAQLWRINPNGTQNVRVPASLTEADWPMFSRDGLALSVSGRSLQRPSMYTANVFLLNPANGGVHQVTQLQDAVVDGNSSYTLALYKAFSPDQRRMAVASYDSVIVTGVGGSTTPMLRVYRMDGFPLALVAMGSPHTLELHAGDGVDWAPGREQILWPTAFRTATGYTATGLFLYDAVTGADEAGRYRQITRHRAGLLPDASGMFAEMDFQPAFSPDGRQIAYVRNVTVNNPFTQPTFASLRVVNADGTNDREVLRFRQGLYVSRVTWSPDGTLLAFDLGNQLVSGGIPYPMMDRTTSTVHVLTLATGAVRQFLGAGTGNPTWQPLTPNPAPQVTSISPAGANAGAATLTLTVNGAGFVPSSRVRWGSTLLTTTFSSATRLTATVPASLMATGGTFPISVSTPAPGGGTSGSVNFVVRNPVPRLTSLAPAAVKAGSAQFTLTVTGSGFVRTSRVRWNGANLTTTFVSGTQLRATVTATRVAAVGTAAVTVANPTPGGGISGTLTFTITR